MARFSTYLSAIALSLFFTGSSWASSITFSTFATNTDNPVIDAVSLINVDDETPGFLTFTVSTQNANALLSGIFLDVAGDLSFDDDDVVSLTDGVEIVDFATDTINIGNGRNFNGGFTDPVNGLAGNFDIAFGFDDGDNGGGSRQIELPFSFSLADFDILTLDSIERIGLRFQSVGTLGQDGLGGGSERLLAVESDPVAVVPLPAAGWLLVSGLAGLGLVRRIRRRSA